MLLRYIGDSSMSFVRQAIGKPQIPQGDEKNKKKKTKFYDACTVY